MTRAGCHGWVTELMTHKRAQDVILSVCAGEHRSVFVVQQRTTCSAGLISLVNGYDCCLSLLVPKGVSPVCWVILRGR